MVKNLLKIPRKKKESENVFFNFLHEAGRGKEGKKRELFTSIPPPPTLLT